MSTTKRSLLKLGLSLVCASVATESWSQPAGKPNPNAAKPPEPITVIQGGRLFTPAPSEGVVVVNGSKIGAVAAIKAVFSGAKVVNASGKIVTPGLVEPLSQTGLVEIDLEPRARDQKRTDGDGVRAAFRAADSFNPASVVIPVTRLGGVTSVGVVPVGGLVAGQSAWADLDGATREEMLVTPLAMHVELGGAETKEGSGVATALLRLREALDDARAFSKSKANYERNAMRELAPSRLDLEALVNVLGGKLRTVIQVQRAADITACLALAKEFGLKLVLAGGLEAWKVRDQLAKAACPVILNPLSNLPESFDSLGARADNAKLLHEAGVTIAFTTQETHNARKLRQVAGNAVRAGLPWSAALRAITLAPAEVLGVADRYGSLEKGKVANVVVWSKDPLELDSTPEHVFIRGREVEKTSRQSALYERYRKR